MVRGRVRVCARAGEAYHDPRHRDRPSDHLCLACDHVSACEPTQLVSYIKQKRIVGRTETTGVFFPPPSLSTPLCWLFMLSAQATPRGEKEGFRCRVDAEDNEKHDQHHYKTKLIFELPSGQPLIIAQDASSGADGGAVVWDPAWPLVEWLVQSGVLSSCTSAVEFGAGTGLVAVAVALLAPHMTVVATDHSQALCDLCTRNGELNGVSITALRHAWGTNNLDDIIAACGEPAVIAMDEDAQVDERQECTSEPRGRVILLSDLFYHNDNHPGRPLDRSVRALLKRGGCSMVVASWKERSFREEAFFGRLRDLGKVVPTVRCANGIRIGVLEVHVHVQASYTCSVV